jgi:indolepyruvate ferredoxin oxidoreductase
MTAISSDFSLDAKFTQPEGLIYLSGVQALVRLPLDHHRADAGRGLRTATFISGYRGSPLGGLDQAIERNGALMAANDVVFSSGLNEDLGATAVFGSQMAALFPRPRYDGVVGMWYGKAPGVDRTGDVFKHANYAGVGRNGGVLALCGDDPISKSSTLPSHSEVALYDAFMPTLFPGNVQDILDLGLHGFMLSRHSGLWVGVKIVTNVADETGTAEVGAGRIRPVIPIVELDGKPWRHEINVNIIPPYGLEMERTLHYARLEMARSYAYENRLNRITVPTPDAWLGILTAGKTYHDVRQALLEIGLPDAALRRYGVRLLKMGMLFPMEPRIVHEFARGLEEVLVVEEKRSFLESFAKETLYGRPDRPRVVGKRDEEERELLPPIGELDADVIARAIARRIARKVRIESVEARIQHLDELKQRPRSALSLARTAYFCSGCPHNRSTVVPDGAVAAAGIGCHGMAMGMNRGIIGVTHMGGEGAQWVGVSPFTETPHLFQNLGDGTLFHSGKLAISYCIAAGVNITYKILYNGAVAMTGGQQAAGALAIPDLTRWLQAEGVKRTIITTDDPERYRGVALAGGVEVWHRDRLLEAQSLLAAISGVTVLLHDQHCAAEKRRLRKRGKFHDPPTRVFINERVCEGCGDCGKKSNCMSVQPVATEFGRKTEIHQSSCNKDYSCLLGDCPSFLTVEPAPGAGKKVRRLTPVPDVELPDPVLKVPADGFALHMMGIGGTGVVTVNQMLGTAALLDGRHVRGLDQTGLSQKGGPVVSDLRIAAQPIEVANKVSAGGADLYLGFDLLVASEPKNLDLAEPGRTVAIVSTGQIPTGQMVVDTTAQFPELGSTLVAIDRVTRKDDNVYVDAQAIAEALFDDHLATNPLLLGVAFQAGALPISAASIEQAIRLNGVAVEMNLLAFRWGRLVVADAAQVERAVKTATGKVATPRVLSAAARALVDLAAGPGGSAELRRILEIRVPELIEYQDEAYARRYADFVRRVGRVEAERTPGRTGLAEAVARHLYKLMAYKDEYEVARLHLDPVLQAEIRSRFGEGARASFNLHPPLLRALGVKKKLRLGAWFTPAFKVLRGMKGLRGTALDPFGRAGVRRLERALIDEYRTMIESALTKLSPATHDTAVAIGALPDLVRGYEDVKLESVARFRAAAGDLMAKLG